MNRHVPQRACCAHGIKHVAIDAVGHDGIAFIPDLVLGIGAIDDADLLNLRHQFAKLFHIRIGEFLGRIDLYHAGCIEAQAVDQAVLDTADERSHGDDRGDANDDAKMVSRLRPLLASSE